MENVLSSRTIPTARIDPKLVLNYNLGNSINAKQGLLSPSYKRAPLGSILQTPPDSTVRQKWEDLPTVPLQKKNLINYGKVTTESINTGSSVEDILEFLPSATPVSHTRVPDQTANINDAKTRATYRVKFSILRDAYPKMSIPEPGEHQSIEEIKAMYEQYVKRIRIDSSVESNKVYLLILWLVIEVVCARFLGLPFKGYTKNQFKYMNKYQMLLIELGERNQHAGIGEGWPVELRILAMATFNGVIFVLVQMLASKIGGDSDAMTESFRNMINNFLTTNNGTDVLRRADEADVDNPAPPVATVSNDPPMGGMGGMLANLVSAFAGGGGLGGGGNTDQAQPAAKPQKKKPTTFGARRKNAAK